MGTKGGNIQGNLEGSPPRTEEGNGIGTTEVERDSSEFLQRPTNPQFPSSGPIGDPHRIKVLSFDVFLSCHTLSLRVNLL